MDVTQVIKAKLIGSLIHQMDNGTFDAFRASEILAHTFSMELEEALDTIMTIKNATL